MLSQPALKVSPCDYSDRVDDIDVLTKKQFKSKVQNGVARMVCVPVQLTDLL